MNQAVQPVVAHTDCARCGARAWRLVRTQAVRGTTIETYECAGAMCLGQQTATGREPWPLSWAHEGVAK
uniref:Uncharacterized protein n=1 Tax=viral metagenome TaxID=1070528 RepID=A0A6M3LGS8_9ZZZZ